MANKHNEKMFGIFSYKENQIKTTRRKTNKKKTMKKTKREIKETIPFTIATKRIKYLGVYLPKETKDLYIKH